MRRRIVPGVKRKLIILAGMEGIQRMFWLVVVQSENARLWDFDCVLKAMWN